MALDVNQKINDIVGTIYQQYNVVLGRSEAFEVYNQLEKAHGASFNTLDVQKELKNPYSLTSQTVNVYVTQEWTKTYQAQQFDIASLLRHQEGLIASLAANTGSNWGEIEVAKDDLRRVEARMDPEMDDFLEVLQQKMQALSTCYGRYQKLSKQFVEQEAGQRDEFDKAITGGGLGDKFKLTPEKQSQLHDLFGKYQGKADTPEFEIQYMGIMLQKGEQENLKPSEVAALARARVNPADPNSGKLYDAFLNAEKSIAVSLKELTVEQNNITRLQSEIAQMQQSKEDRISQNNTPAAQTMRAALAPGFLVASNSNELMGKLEQLRSLAPPSSMDAESAFQCRLAAQLRNMPSEARDTFMEQLSQADAPEIRGNKPLSESQMNLVGLAHATALEVAEAEAPAAEAEAEKHKALKMRPDGTGTG